MEPKVFLSQAYQILSLGIIGLVFLMALFSFYLLIREQKKREPRTKIIKAIYRFMIFSLILCVISVLGKYFESRKPGTGDVSIWTVDGLIQMDGDIPTEEIKVEIEPPEFKVYSNGRFKIKNVPIHNIKNPPSLTIRRKGYKDKLILLEVSPTIIKPDYQILHFQKEKRIEITGIVLEEVPETTYNPEVGVEAIRREEP